MITYPCRDWSKSRVRSFGSLPGTLKVHVHWYFRRCVLLANVFVTILSKMHLFSLKTRKVPFSNEVVLDGQRRKSPLFTNHIQLVCLYKSQILLYIILVCVCAGNRDFARLYQSMSWDVIKWKHFPRYWPFVGEFIVHRWIPLTKTSDLCLNKRLSKQPWGW